MRRKADLPAKTCLVCGRPFAWRKKWARDWDSVKYCSDRCRAVPGPGGPHPGGPTTGRASS
jgi:hypothetical protein